MNEKLIEQVVDAIECLRVEKLTKREQFALAAMQAMIAGAIQAAGAKLSEQTVKINWKLETITNASFEVADAMLAHGKEKE